MFPLKIKIKTRKAKEHRVVLEGSVELASCWSLPWSLSAGSPAWVWAASLALAVLPGQSLVGWADWAGGARETELDLALPPWAAGLCGHHVVLLCQRCCHSR